MQIQIEVDGRGKPFDASERDAIVAGAGREVAKAAPGASVHVLKLGPGEFGHVDFSIFHSVLEFGEKAAISGVISGFVRSAIDQLRPPRPITIRVGDASVELPGNATPEQIQAATQKLTEAAQKSAH